MDTKSSVKQIFYTGHCKKMIYYRYIAKTYELQCTIICVIICRTCAALTICDTSRLIGFLITLTRCVENQRFYFFLKRCRPFVSLEAKRSFDGPLQPRTLAYRASLHVSPKNLNMCLPSL